MKKLLSLAWLAVLFAACQDETITPQQPEVLPHRLVQGNMAYEIAYTAEGKLAQLTTTTTYPGGTLVHDQYFLYTNDGKIAESTTSSGWRFVYAYAAGRISETEEYLDGNLSQKHTFAYDGKGRVTESITFQDIPEEGGWIPVQRSTYTYDPTGNVLENKLYYYGTGGAPENLLTVNTFSDYDNKRNTEAAFEIFSIHPMFNPFVNNPGKLEIRNGNGHLSVTETYRYTYRADGFAETKTTKSIFGGNTEEYATSYFFLEP